MSIRRGSFALVAALCASVAALTTPMTAAAAPKPPMTGFEERSGASWTTHAEELGFLRAVDRLSARTKVAVIGASELGRPMHLVRIGHPRPPTAEAAGTKPVALFLCSQHCNEPAPREGCLQMLRTLAFTSDPAMLRLLKTWTVLFIPSANPDGRAANTRENANGVDVNRDHLNLASQEARVIAKVLRDWRPDVAVDHHEFGPGIPVLYDDDLLYLWPRNLNVDAQVHALSKTLAIDYIGAGSQRAGYTADEYGLYAVGDQDVQQTAGDGDEGILRNTAGLRHTIGILVESKVDMRLSPDEVLSSSAVNVRRVASHRRTMIETLRFMREQEATVTAATDGAPVRKAREGLRRDAPVYFGGADNDPPAPSEIVDPPPCEYRLSGASAKRVEPALRLHGILFRREPGRVVVPMAQPAEPVIPLLLDARGARASVAGTVVDRC